MSSNPFSSPPGCATCSDLRMVADGHAARPCPVCGCSCPPRGKGDPPPVCPGCAKSRDLKRAAFIRYSPLPTIHVLDLTPAEAEWHREQRKLGISSLSILGQIEGRRYDPAKDPAFMAKCVASLATWKTLLGLTEAEKPASTPAEVRKTAHGASQAPRPALGTPNPVGDGPPAEPVVRNGQETEPSAKTASNPTVLSDSSGEFSPPPALEEESDDPPF